MSEKKGRDRSSIQIFRERLGEALKEAQRRHREADKVRKLIVQALRSKAATVPELSKETGLAAHEVFWHLMAMKKYGEVVEMEERGSYFAYALKDKGTEGKEKQAP